MWQKAAAESKGVKVAVRLRKIDEGEGGGQTARTGSCSGKPQTADRRHHREAWRGSDAFGRLFSGYCCCALLL